VCAYSNLFGQDLHRDGISAQDYSSKKAEEKTVVCTTVQAVDKGLAVFFADELGNRIWYNRNK